jgi:hypothetical protein
MRRAPDIILVFLIGVFIGLLFGYYTGLSSTISRAVAEKTAVTTPATEAGKPNTTTQRAWVGKVNVTTDILVQIGETASLGPWKITVYDVKETRCVKSISGSSRDYWLFASYYCAPPNKKIVVVRMRIESDNVENLNPFGGYLPRIKSYPELITNTGSSYKSNRPGTLDGVVRISVPSEDIVGAAVTYRYEGFIEGTVTEEDFGYVIPESERPATLRMVYETIDHSVTVIANLTSKAPDVAVRHSKTVIVGKIGETIVIGRWKVAMLDVRETLCIRVVTPEREEYCGAPRGGKIVLVTLAFENAGSDAARLEDYFLGWPTLYTSEGIRVFSESLWGPCNGRGLPCAAEERANAIDYSLQQSLDLWWTQKIGPGERVVTHVIYVVAESDTAKRLYIVYEPRYERRAEFATIEINIR